MNILILKGKKLQLGQLIPRHDQSNIGYNYKNIPSETLTELKNLTKMCFYTIFNIHKEKFYIRLISKRPQTHSELFKINKT